MGIKIKYPIGIQTFSEIIEEGYKYVDKTRLVYELTKQAKYIFLSRPRRFGKSLLMSTLESYFKGEKELFAGLAIEKLEKEWESYPVIRFDLSPANYDGLSKVIECIDACIRSIEFEYGIQADGENITVRFLSLIQKVYYKVGKKVVILIDEYDKPMLDCIHDIEMHEKVKAELRGFYAAIKASDRYIKFAMLTGITKFGKVNIFSGLNNLKDISMLPKYNDICGISETEFHDNFKESIAEFAAAEGIPDEEAWCDFKLMYDGYHFAISGEGIYNPYSVMNAFDDKVLGSFWYESGSPSFLIKLIEKNNYALDKLDGARRSKSELCTDMSWDIVPLLFQSGYLTIKDYDAESEEYLLGFPNKEVNKAFWDSLASRFFRCADGLKAFNLQK